MKDFRQELYENGYFRQEELCFADCDRYQRARVSGLLNKAAAYAESLQDPQLRALAGTLAAHHKQRYEALFNFLNGQQ